MIIDWLLLIPLIVGHLALFVLVLNVSHSTNMPEKLLAISNMALLLVTLFALPFLVSQGPWIAWPLVSRSYALLCIGTSMVGLPLVTLLRSFRRLPVGVESRGEVLDLATEPGIDRVVGEGKHHWLLRLPGNQSLRVSKVECDLTLPNLPRGLDGLTLVQLTDLHFSHCYRREFFEIVAEEAARWDADLVVFTGDLLDDTTTLDWVDPVFSRLRGRLGQYAILGNHDHRLRPGRARRALRRAGFVDLEGRWDRIDLGGATLAIGGTSAPWGPPLDYSAMCEADFRIVLSHSPDQFPNASSAGVELVLAGHNHGGQIRLPGFGPILMPSRYSRHFDRGFFRSRDGASTLYVSQGVGGKHPIRYGCTPEITRFTLRATPAARLPHAREQADAGLVRGW
jgi:predicted MPP superfamily phosphohydrolase